MSAAHADAQLAPVAISRQQAAERWAVSLYTIDQLIAAGHIKAKVYGSSKRNWKQRKLVLVASLDAYFTGLEDA